MLGAYLVFFRRSGVKAERLWKFNSACPKFQAFGEWDKLILIHVLFAVEEFNFSVGKSVEKMKNCYVKIIFHMLGFFTMKKYAA